LNVSLKIEEETEAAVKFFDIITIGRMEHNARAYIHVQGI
jgi:hypothetical protein